MTASSESTARAQSIIRALSLPQSCRVDQRVPKKLLLENGAPTAADKRLITEAIEEIQWVAALKPNTIGVPDYRDAVREYLEVAVLTITLKAAVKPAGRSRLAELLHRGVPYPVLLLMSDEQEVTLSLAHKRWAQKEAGKVVLDGGLVSAALSASPPENADQADAERAFIESLSVARQPQASLQVFYQSWMDRIHALLAARLTGRYRPTNNPEQAAARRQALMECERLEAEASRLRAMAAKEKQLARQVELNLALQRVQAELIAARKQL